MPTEPATQKVRLIIDGNQLEGSAMPKLVADFRIAVVGRKIVNAGYAIISGEPYPCLVLDTGETIYCQMDDEGNGPGSLVLGKSDAVLCKCEVKS